MWMTLVVIGMISTFGTAPGSIEGFIYTKAVYEGLWGGQIEVLCQSFLFSALAWYWVNHPEKGWLSWAFGIMFIVTLALSALGLLARQMMS